jgi:hypothetical protein
MFSNSKLTSLASICIKPKYQQKTNISLMDFVKQQEIQRLAYDALQIYTDYNEQVP